MSDTRTIEKLVAGVRADLNAIAIHVDDEYEEACREAIHAALDTLTSRLEALEAEHEAAKEMREFIDHGYGWTRLDIDRFKAAHDHAERVIRDE